MPVPVANLVAFLTKLLLYNDLSCFFNVKYYSIEFFQYNSKIECNPDVPILHL